MINGNHRPTDGGEALRLAQVAPRIRAATMGAGSRDGDPQGYRMGSQMSLFPPSDKCRIHGLLVGLKRLPFEASAFST